MFYIIARDPEMAEYLMKIRPEIDIDEACPDGDTSLMQAVNENVINEMNPS